MTSITASITDRVFAELRTVIDPCARHNGTRLTFVDLGMVEEVVDKGGGVVLVRLLLDDPVCLFMVDIQAEVRQAALRVSGVEAVEIEIIGDQLWTQDRLTDETKAKMARWRVIRVERAEQRTVKEA